MNNKSINAVEKDKVVRDNPQKCDINFYLFTFKAFFSLTRAFHKTNNKPLLPSAAAHMWPGVNPIKVKIS